MLEQLAIPELLRILWSIVELVIKNWDIYGWETICQ